MTKGERRRFRREAQKEGRPLTGELALHRDCDSRGPAVEFSESQRGYHAREKWARYYDGLNGRPEDEWDR